MVTDVKLHINRNQAVTFTRYRSNTFEAIITLEY